MPSYIMSFVVTCASDSEAARWQSEADDAISAAGASAEIQGAAMVGSGEVGRIYDGTLVAT